MKQNQTLDLTPATSPAPQYALHRGLGVWEVVFAGQRTVLKEETGLLYVAYLLTIQPPREPLHGFALTLRASALYGRVEEGATEITDPVSGEALVVDRTAELQQRSLAFEEAEALWALRQKQLELEAIVDDPHQIEPVKAEAERELLAIYEYEKRNRHRTLSVAQKSVRAVRMAINRFHRNLAQALDATGAPHPVLRPFGDHVESYVIIPSSRCFRRNGQGGRVGVVGSFVYEPPAEVTWVV